jgi:hypothetical protein
MKASDPGFLSLCLACYKLSSLMPSGLVFKGKLCSCRFESDGSRWETQEAQDTVTENTHLWQHWFL